MRNKVRRSLLMVGVIVSFAFVQKEKKVYICDSSTAYAYHYYEDCRGLARCTHKIIAKTEPEAKKEEKRRLCGYCRNR